MINTGNKMSASSVSNRPSNASKILRDVAEFRRSPTAFFVAHMTDEDGFVLDLLQSMYSEDIPEVIKIQLVGVLEEKASILLTNPTSIEQTIGSLKNIYRQTDSKSWIFHSQLLVAMTAILLGLNQLAEQQQLVVDLINLLLELISNVNNGSDRLLRGTACECLREIETMHPGILMRKVENLYSMIQLERTHVCQSYMALFVTVFKNAVVCVASSHMRDNDAISDLLCHRKELLKPLNLPDDFTSDMFQLEPKNDFETALLPSSVNTSELKRASAFLMESLCLMTTPMQCYILSHIMQYIATVPSLSSSTFKSHLLELSCTLDLSLFHLALQLKAVFKGELINDADEEMLLRRLLLCINHPSLTTAHRLLCSDWLRYFPENGNSRKVGTLPKKIMANNNLRALLPKVFDGLDTTLIKLSMLNECFTPSSTEDTSNGILMGCLQPLQKSIHHGITGRTAVTLYRSVFQYFRKHHNSYLKNDIFSLLLSTVLKHPVFAPHTINFLHCVPEVVPESKFPVELLRVTAEDILQLNPHVILRNLDNYLKLLERISAEKNINPKPTLGFLHQLLVSSDLCAEGNWLLGNSVLAVCNSCMHHHNTTDIFTDVGTVLYVMLTEFNDIDVRDRARFYYAILTNLSTEKVSRVLSQANESSRSLSKLADSINIPSSSPVQKFKKSVLQLTRVSKEPPTLLTLPNPAEFTLPDYLDKIRDPEVLASVTVNYKLHMDDDSELEEHIKDIYAIVLHLETSSNYKKMTDYQVPHLSRKDGRGVIVQLNFVPHYPIPTSFSVSALFSLSLSRTATCQLADLHVKFEDLFLPLPVSPEVKELLFKKLWQDIRDVEQKSSTSLCTESVCVLQITMERMNVIVANDLADFAVAHYTSEEQEKKWFVGIFLPPQSHLLLRIASNACNSVVSIATDNWKILALVNKYLHELENQ